MQKQKIIIQCDTEKTSIIEIAIIKYKVMPVMQKMFYPAIFVKDKCSFKIS